MIDSNNWLVDFIGNNWMGLTLVYMGLKAMFPNSKLLNAIGEGAKGMFPQFRKNGSGQVK